MSVKNLGMDSFIPSHAIADPAKALQFVLAGRATLTIMSEKTGDHYTYQINKRKDPEPLDTRSSSAEPVWFVKLLTAPDTYTYVGMIVVYPNGTHFCRTTRASSMDQSSPPIKAINFMFQFLDIGRIHSDMKIYHDGACGRCRRPLTTPESIETGFGPECSEILGIERARVAVNADRSKSRHAA